MDIYQDLAYKSIVYYFKNRTPLPLPDNLPSELISKKAGVFVSLHTENNELRGCIGTFLPTQKNIALEIIKNALLAAFEDPRFSPLKENELENIKIKVDVLSEPKLVSTLKELSPRKYGVLLKTESGKSGLLLPDLGGVDSVEQQIDIACQKAGINPIAEKFETYKFTVERHE